MFRKILLISLLMLFMIGCKKSPTIPEEPPYYRAKVEVTYKRNPAKIRVPQANDAFVITRYELFDPDPNPDPDRFPDDYYEGSHRYGTAQMEKIAKNKFRGYVEHVFVQTSPYHPKHIVYIRDYKLWAPPQDDTTRTSMYTGEGLKIQGAYDEEVIVYQKGTKRKFKMGKN